MVQRHPTVSASPPASIGTTADWGIGGSVASEIEHSIAVVVKALVDRDLVAPARLLLELHRPILGVAQAAAMGGLYVFAPLLSFLGGANLGRQMMQLLAEPGSLELLRQRLETIEGQS